MRSIQSPSADTFFLRIALQTSEVAESLENKTGCVVDPNAQKGADSSFTTCQTGIKAQKGND